MESGFHTSMELVLAFTSPTPSLEGANSLMEWTDMGCEGGGVVRKQTEQGDLGDVPSLQEGPRRKLV